jgi:uncharacterized repeat protein (TIGR03847 family)
MADTFDIDLDPVSFITVGTAGPPGQRTFFLQASQARRVVALIIEKQQAEALATAIQRILSELARRDPEGHAARLRPLDTSMALLQPIEAEFRAGQIGLGADEERESLILVADELTPDEDERETGRRARFVATYAQMLSLAHHAIEVVGQGRPTCPLCGEPIDPEGHFCPRSNGHHGR